MNLTRETRWVCPNCTTTAVTNIPEIHSQFHACAGLKGMTAPMVEAGIRCKVEAVEREDYVNGEAVQTDGENRPIMSIITTRDDGQDCMVMAPVATGKGES